MTNNSTAKAVAANDANATKNTSSEAQNLKNFRKIQKKNLKSGTKPFGEKTPEFALATE